MALVLHCYNVTRYNNAPHKGFEPIALCIGCSCAVTADDSCSECGSFYCMDCDTMLGYEHNLCAKCV